MINANIVCQSSDGERDQVAFPRVFLVGFMASGKTFLGGKLSCLMGMPFLDLDAFVEQNHGLSVSSIFAQFGESRFRDLESESLDMVIRNKPAVVSTGGGTACFNENMFKLKANGIVVYLRRSVGLLVARLSSEAGKRPLVAGKSAEALREYVIATLEKREPFYSQAHLVYDGSDARELFKLIVRWQKSNAQCL